MGFRRGLTCLLIPPAGYKYLLIPPAYYKYLLISGLQLFPNTKHHITVHAFLLRPTINLNMQDITSTIQINDLLWVSTPPNLG